MAPISALGAWHMGQWGEMEDYVAVVDNASSTASSTGSFLRGVLCVHKQEYKAARGELRRGSFGCNPLRILGCRPKPWPSTSPLELSCFWPRIMCAFNPGL
jgi:FAT domain